MDGSRSSSALPNARMREVGIDVAPLEDDSDSEDEGRVYETQPVEISLACLKLPPFELTGSCMSVFAVLWMYRSKDNRWQEHGRSDVVRHGNSPQFARSFFINYVINDDPISFAKTDQWLRVDIYQRNSTLPHLSSHIKHGEMKFTLRELYRTPVKRIVRALTGGQDEDQRDAGSVVVRIAPVKDTSGYCEITVTARNLGSVTSRAMCNTFLEVSRYSHGQFETVSRSELARNTISPRYPQIEVSTHRLCFNNGETYLRFDIYNEQNAGTHIFLGRVETSLDELLAPSSRCGTTQFLLSMKDGPSLPHSAKANRRKLLSTSK